MKKTITGAQALDARKALQLNQAEVAKAVGISRAYLSQFETGVREVTASQKTILRDFFEEEGFIFDDSIEHAVEAVEAETKKLQKNLGDKETVSVSALDLSALVSQVDDLILAVTNPKSGDLQKSSTVEENPELTSTSLAGDELLYEFMDLDARGESPDLGFFEDMDAKAQKLISCMAVQYLRQKALETGKLIIPLSGLGEVGEQSFGKYAKAVAEQLEYLISQEKLLKSPVFDEVSAV